MVTLSIIPIAFLTYIILRTTDNTYVILISPYYPQNPYLSYSTPIKNGTLLILKVNPRGNFIPITITADHSKLAYQLVNPT